MDDSLQSVKGKQETSWYMFSTIRGNYIGFGERESSFADKTIVLPLRGVKLVTVMRTANLRGEVFWHLSAHDPVGYEGRSNCPRIQ